MHKMLFKIPLYKNIKIWDQEHSFATNAVLVFVLHI